MKLISLELKNFRQYLDASITFPDGVTGIIGPNGAGKTTILEAIAWALYGAPAVRGKNENIRSMNSEPGSKVSATLTFGLGGHIYRISRYLEPSGERGQAVLEIDGRPSRTGMSDVSEAVTRLLGMDYRAFFTSFFTGQKQLEFMAALDAREREAAISKMLGYDRLSKAREKANQDRIGLEREIKVLENTLPDHQTIADRKKQAQEALSEAKAQLQQAEQLYKEAKTRVEQLEPVKKASDQKANEYRELTQQLELKNESLKITESRLEQIRKELDELNARREELKSLQPHLKRYEEAKNEYNKLKELQKYEAERQQITGRLKTLEEELARLRERLNQSDSAKRRREELTAQLSKTEADLKAVEERIRTLREERVAKQHSLTTEREQLEKQRSEIKTKHAQIEQAGEEGECPTCERPLGKELGSVLGRFEKEIEQINTRISDLEKELSHLSSYDSLIHQANTERDNLAAEYEKLQDLKAEVEATLKDCEKAAREIELKETEISRLRKRLSELPEGFDQKRFQELHRIGEELRPYRDREVAIRTALDREPGLRKEETSLLEQVAELKESITDLTRSIEELGFSHEEHESITREFEDATRTLNSISVELERCRGEYKLANSILENLENEEREYRRKEEELKAKRSENAHLRTLVKAFDELRAELNERIRPELESAASELLSVMTDGRYNLLRITDDYRPVIVDDGEEKPVISGGEDDIVNLSLRLAISQMIADRAGQSFSLLILDEVFGSLDETRRQNVVNLLQNLKNRFEQIILITHIESIYDALDNCLWVEFDERTKTSRIVERRVEQPDVISIGA